MKKQDNVGGTTCTNQELIPDYTTNLHKSKEKDKQWNKKIYQKKKKVGVCDPINRRGNQRAKRNINVLFATN